MSDKYHKVIGIDLGTTYSAVSVYNRQEETTEIIPNPESIDGMMKPKPETTPSVVSHDPITKKVIVGWPAKKNVGDTANTIIEIKREMGEMFREDTIEKYHARDYYNRQIEMLRNDEKARNEGVPVRVSFVDDWYLPQEISAFTLMKMKEVAEAHIGEPIIDAVVTVPAYFTEKQKQATKEAALLAGLYPRQLIPEPTAAAICYGIDRLESQAKNYLVYDLGGGTFDVSIIRVEDTNINVLATSGDPRLGGGDFDDAIVAWVVKGLAQQQLDPTQDREKMARIKAHAEQAKKDLSTLSEVTMTFIDVWPQQPPSLVLTRDVFQTLIEDLLKKSLSYVDLALTQARDKRGLQREDLNSILLVGGSTKIPRVKALLLAHFQQEESFVSAGLNPDEVVARGAASVALKFAPSVGPFDVAKRPDASQLNPDAQDELHIDLITEHSLGIGVQNNLVSRIIDQGTNIPVSRRESNYTNPGPIEYIDVGVYQGEGTHIYENTLIGTLKIGPMELKPEGAHRFDVTFSLDANGLLSVTIHHLNENKNFQGKFEQKGVGGNEALAAKRAKLLKLCGVKDGPAVPPPPPPPPPQRNAQAGGGPIPNGPAPSGQTAPPGGPGVPGGPIAPSGPVASAAASHPAPPMPSTEPVTGNGSHSSHAPVPTAAATATAPPPQAASGGVVQAKVDVPAEFKQAWRRANKKLLDGGTDKLRDAFNRFVTLLNEGASGDQLEEAGDTLADAYDECK